MNGTCPVLERLRAATGASHRALEAEFDAIDRLASPRSRPETLARYAAFYRGAASLLAPWFAGDARWIESERARLAQLPPFAVPSLDPLAGRPEALGLHYVVEGSALGGRMILRALAGRGVPLEGLGFLDRHGEGAGAHWRAVLTMLRDELDGDPALTEQAAAGAQYGFAFARHCFCAPFDEIFSNPPDGRARIPALELA